LCTTVLTLQIILVLLADVFKIKALLKFLSVCLIEIFKSIAGSCSMALFMVAANVVTRLYFRL